MSGVGRRGGRVSGRVGLAAAVLATSALALGSVHLDNSAAASSGPGRPFASVLSRVVLGDLVVAGNANVAAMAERGDLAAQTLFGQCLLAGDSAGQEEAIGWLEKASKRNDESATATLLQAYVDGRLKPDKQDQVAALVKRAEEGKSPAARFEAAYAYGRGIGVDR